MGSVAENNAENSAAGWRFDNSYSRLSEVLFASAKPGPAREPRVAILNEGLAAELGLDLRRMSPDAAAKLFTGQELPEGSQPIAQAYAGHQFGGFTMLGDGRAILLGEHRTPSGRLVDIQLKGAGLTRFSRGGDGRAALGPMLREYIISEAMFALGIPTTRSLAVVTTGEPVYRTSALRGAILTRVAASHIRVGTFQYLAARQDTTNLRALADYAIDRHYPELIDTSPKYLEFFRAVMDRQASLIARWQLVGFIHGVMNTDNMAISGETLDYGPCAFMDTYDPNTVFSSIDSQGRYSYANQPAIAQWNLARLAEALLPLFDANQTQAVEMASASVARFGARFDHHWLAGMRAKLGLVTADDADSELAQGLLGWMHDAGADFTNTFRQLSVAGAMDTPLPDGPAETWRRRWLARLARESRPAVAVAAHMQQHNAAIIPRNHKVEEALAAAERGDLSALHALLDALSSPYDHTRARPDFTAPPHSGGRPYRTFCGT